MMGHVPDFDQTRGQIRLTENMTEDILQSEPVEFELVQTSLGDCGCVSTGVGYRKSGEDRF